MTLEKLMTNNYLITLAFYALIIRLISIENKEKGEACQIDSRH